jgi:hypothetical protein
MLLWKFSVGCHSLFVCLVFFFNLYRMNSEHDNKNNKVTFCAKIVVRSQGFDVYGPLAFWHIHIVQHDHYIKQT